MARTSWILVALLIAGSPALALRCADVATVNEGAPLWVTQHWEPPGQCVGFAAVRCDSSTQCPNDAECVTATETTPTDYDCIVTAISKGRICAGGANVGISCKVDADCPSSTCGADVLMAWTDFNPVASSHTFMLSRICAGGANVGMGCWSDGDCPSSTCSGALINRVVVATTSAEEMHALTCVTPEAGPIETRFCVRRQRWAPP